jgi:hypothetical protein
MLPAAAQSIGPHPACRGQVVQVRTPASLVPPGYLSYQTGFRAAEPCATTSGLCHTTGSRAIEYDEYQQEMGNETLNDVGRHCPAAKRRLFYRTGYADTGFWVWPVLGPLLFENESSDARDHCANERSMNLIPRPSHGSNPSQLLSAFPVPVLNLHVCCYAIPSLTSSTQPSSHI